MSIERTLIQGATDMCAVVGKCAHLPIDAREADQLSIDLDGVQLAVFEIALISGIKKSTI